jgi:hypothetical protein
MSRRASTARTVRERNAKREHSNMIFDKLFADSRRWGWARSLWMRIIPRLQRYSGIHVYRVLLRGLMRDRPEPDLDGITVRIARLDELLKAAEDPDLDMEPEFARAALQRGDVVFGAFYGDRLVTYAFRSISALPHAEDHDVWARGRRPYVLAYKGYTRPLWRGKRLHAAVARCSDAYFLERGYTAEVNFIELTNFSSVRQSRFMERKQIGYFGYISWFGHVIPFRSPVVKKMGIELFKPRPREGAESAADGYHLPATSKPSDE